MWRKFKKEEKGQALVEMALVVTILLLLIMAIVEFGWIFGAQLMATHSTREGARYGAVNAATDPNVVSNTKNRVLSTASLMGLTGDNISVILTNTGNPSNGDIEVKVDYDVPVTSPLISVFTGSVVNVQAKCVMKVE